MAHVFKKPRAAKHGGGFYPEWRLSYTDASGRKVERNLRTRNRRHADVMLAEQVAAVEAEKANPMPRTGDGSQLFADLVKEFDETVGPTLRERVNRKRQLDAWAAYFGERARLRDIRQSVIEARKAQRLSAGKTPATVNRDIAALKALLSRAVAWKRIPYNAADDVRLEREDNERMRVLDEAEESRLVAEARVSGNPWLASLILIALNTGGRRGELLALRWTDVDMERRVVRFTKTKARRSRTVPLNKAAIKELRRIERKGDRVFALRGKAVLDVKRSFMNARDRAGLGPDVTFHGLRHTFATRLAEQGVSPSIIQRLLGHSSLAMVQRYTHVSDAASRQAVDKLNLGRPDIRAVGARGRKQHGSR